MNIAKIIMIISGSSQGPISWSISWFLQHEVTRSISTPPWICCQSITGLSPALNSPVYLRRSSNNFIKYVLLFDPYEFISLSLPSLTQMKHINDLCKFCYAVFWIMISCHYYMISKVIFYFSIVVHYALYIYILMYWYIHVQKFYGKCKS